MGFTVSTKAAKWFKEEFELAPGDHVTFFAKIYGGIPTIYPDYFLGISINEKEGIPTIKVVGEGITFYIANGDKWLVDGYDLRVEIKNNEVDCIFTES